MTGCVLSRQQKIWVLRSPRSKTILDHAVQGDSPCPMVRNIVEKRIEENKAKIRELKQLQKRLENAAEVWKTMKDSTPDGHSVCRLIESFADDTAKP